jgi:hypothetical protein
MPRPVRRRCFPAQDIEIAVVRTYFVEGILWAVPLVKYLLDHVLAILKSCPGTTIFCIGREKAKLSYFWKHC